MEPPGGGGGGGSGGDGGGGDGGWPGWDPAAGRTDPQAAFPGQPAGYQPRPKGGNERTGPLPLHPMSLPDILDGSFNLFKAEFRSIVLVTAAFLVPVQIVAAFLQRDYLGGAGFISLFTDPSTAESALDSGTAGQGWATLLGLAAGVLIVPFVAGAVSRIVSAAYLGERMSPRDALRAVGSKWWAFIVAWILVHLLEAVGAVFCVVPGLMVMALFVPVAPTIAIEGLGPIKAMRRSFRLVKPRLWPVLGIALLSGLVASTVSSVIGGVPSAMSLVVGLEWGWPLLAVGSILSGLVSTPLIAIVATLVYYDGRIRQEGLDLQVMAADLARGERRL
jgi:uncharacterized membrane protein